MGASMSERMWWRFLIVSLLGGTVTVLLTIYYQLSGKRREKYEEQDVEGSIGSIRLDRIGWLCHDHG
jgi:hypothetical protein